MAALFSSSLATFFICAVQVFAQTTHSSPAASLVGRIVDATDSAGIANADVQIVGTELLARTDGRGRFAIQGIPMGLREIQVRAFRYTEKKQSHLFNEGDSLRLDIFMHRVPQLLSEMIVLGRAFRVPRGFETIYERAAHSWGTLITREQIDSVNPLDLKTMLQNIPGVFVDEGGIYFNKCYGNQLFAQELAELWIDGDRVTKFNRSGRTDGADAVDTRYMNEYFVSTPPSEVQAIEVYTASDRIPPEFASGGSPCAVIAVWTKRGP